MRDDDALTQLKAGLNRGFELMQDSLDRHQAAVQVSAYGTVSFVSSGIAHVTGLPGIRYEELIRFDQGSLGIAFNVARDEIGVVMLDEGRGLGAGNEAGRMRQVVSVPVGEGLLGRVVDARGRPLDQGGALGISTQYPVESDAPAIMDRSPVTVPLQTGLKVVDALIPIGRGQRELILGDRQTGKTAIAVDTIINQKKFEVICIYCAIGKRVSSVAKVIDVLRQYGAMDYTCVVVATEEDPPGLQYTAPYAAMTVGEYFMRQGRDVLLVMDDLTRHARAYREVSLLLRRPPGREAYPGDIFFIHSRLLERSTHLKEELGGGSLTALPIIETEAQNMSAYIPTNLISITDGQIYLSPTLFSKGHLPAVDVGRSVSRVGGKTQLAAYRNVAGDLRLAYSQFEELESFARFGTRMDEETRRSLARGRRVREILKQPQYQPLPVSEQIAALVAVNQGVLDDIALERIGDFEEKLRGVLRDRIPEVCDRIEKGEAINDEDLESLKNTARSVLDGAADSREA